MVKPPSPAAFDVTAALLGAGSGKARGTAQIPNPITETVTVPSATFAANQTISTGALFVGGFSARSAGTLNIVTGGTVTDGQGVLGFLASTEGTVTVTGTGSTWTILNNLIIDEGGKAELTIQDNGLVHTIDGIVQVAAGEGTGTLNIGAAPSSSPVAPKRSKPPRCYSDQD
jgi:T5SS/PEP-CTERM-associated repeat protein